VGGLENPGKGIDLNRSLQKEVTHTRKWREAVKRRKKARKREGGKIEGLRCKPLEGRARHKMV